MLDEGGIVQSILDEVGEILHLVVAQAEARLRTWSTRVREPGRERERGAGDGILRYADIKVLHHVPNGRERTVVEECARVLELAQRHDAELKHVVLVVGDLFPARVLGVVGEAVLAKPGKVEMAPR